MHTSTPFLNANFIYFLLLLHVLANISGLWICLWLIQSPLPQIPKDKQLKLKKKKKKSITSIRKKTFKNINKAYKTVGIDLIFHNYKNNKKNATLKHSTPHILYFRGVSRKQKVNGFNEEKFYSPFPFLINLKQKCVHSSANCTMRPH